MSTRKSRFVFISLRIGWLPIVLLVPLRCAAEVLEGALDILSLFGRGCRKVFSVIDIAENALMMVRDYGPLDMVDVDVKSPDARVKVKVLMR